MSSRLVAIGGGELKTRETLSIDTYIAETVKKEAGERRPCGLFLPTASHDCMPYYNTFHKVYTGCFDIKTDVLLTVNREVDLVKAQSKFDRADFLYVGGGNTVFMLEEWRQKGILPMIERFFLSGKLVCGLSAGAICWFETMYTDSFVENDYALYEGLGWIKGKISPHYNQRMLDFDKILVYNKMRAWGIGDNAAMEFVDGEPVRTLSCGGDVYELDATSGELCKRKLVLPEE